MDNKAFSEQNRHTVNKEIDTVLPDVIRSGSVIDNDESGFRFTRSAELHRCKQRKVAKNRENSTWSFGKRPVPNR